MNQVPNSNLLTTRKSAQDTSLSFAGMTANAIYFEAQQKNAEDAALGYRLKALWHYGEYMRLLNQRL